MKQGDLPVEADRPVDEHGIPELRTIEEIQAYRDWIGTGQPQHVYGKVAGTDQVVKVRGEDNGTHVGEQIYHWDGRVSAKVRPETVTLLPGATQLGKVRVEE